MASVASIVFFGRLYGLFDIKTLIIVSVILFEVGSAVCGAAPTMNALTVGRVVLEERRGKLVSYNAAWFLASLTQCNATSVHEKTSLR